MGKIKQKQEIHKFSPGVDMIHPVCDVGDASVATIQQELEFSDENYYAGKLEMKKYSMPAFDAVAVLGARELAAGIKAEMNQITITSGRVQDLIRTGEMSMVDLSDGKRLKERLSTLDRVTGFQKHQIEKHRETAYDLLLLKTELQKRDKVQKLDETLREHFESNNFFDLQQKKTHELLKMYLNSTDNDVLRNINPFSMSRQKIQKLLKSGEKNGFQEADKAAIRLVGKQMKMREANMQIGKLINFRKHLELLRSYTAHMDGITGEGVKQITSTVQILNGAFAVGKFGLKSGVVSASFVAKYTGVSILLHKLNQIRMKKSDQLRQAVKDSQQYKAIVEQKKKAREKVSTVKKNLNEKLDQTTTIQKYKNMQRKTREMAKMVAQKSCRIRAASNAARRNMKHGTDIVFAPFRFVGGKIGKILKGLEHIRMALVAAVGIVVAIFLIIIVLVNSILSVCTVESDAAVSVILTEDDTFVMKINSNLQVEAEKKRNEAKQIAGGVPQNPYVYAGHTISSYGSPDGKKENKGSKIIYLDGKGNTILNGMNNIKECIAMSYVIMCGDFDTDTKARDDLILDMWKLMNPAVTYKESPIYLCTSGCNSFSYCCNDTSDYDMLNAYRAEGVGVYGNMKSYDKHGDDGKGRCAGHSVTVCYGHKDVEVYVTVKMMDEMFESGELPSSKGKSYKAYIESFEGWTEDNREWVQCLVNADWYDTYGVDPSGGAGFVAGSGMTAEEIAAIIDTYGDVDAIRKEICSDAMDFVGRIPYYWGGKASAKDYAANNFNTIIKSDEKGRNKKGLDCSGFVQWIIWRVTDVKVGVSTATITTGMQSISAAELTPGDLGLMSVPGSRSNHVGIFVGYNKSGQALWCHENSSSGNVAVNNSTCFKYYYRIF